MAKPWEEYQSGSSSSSGPKPWEEYSGGDKVVSNHPESSSDEGQTALESYGNTVSLGYLPHIQAAVQPAVNKVMGFLGSKAEDEPYVNLRDENIKRIENQESQNPKSALVGKGAGIAASMATPMPFAKIGTGIIGGVAKGAAIGGGYGAFSNPGDTEGVVSPNLQGKERLANAERGMLTGGLIGGGSAAASKGIGMLANASKGAKKLANDQALSAMGSTVGDMRALDHTGKLDNIGTYALEKGIIEAGDSVKEIAQKSEQHLKNSGQVLGHLYDKAVLASEAKPDASARGFNPVKDKQSILNTIKSRLGNSTDKAQAIKNVENYLDQLKLDHGDKILDPFEANDIKSKIDQKIKWEAGPATSEKATQQAFRELRAHVANAVDNHIEDLGKAVGDESLTKTLREANKDYSYAKTINDISRDRLFRNQSNQALGLKDAIVGAGGSAAAAALSHDPLTSIAVGAASAGANKAMRTYGSSSLASGANMASTPLKAVEPIGKAADAIFRPNVISRGLIQNKTNKHPFTRRP